MDGGSVTEGVGAGDGIGSGDDSGRASGGVALAAVGDVDDGGGDVGRGFGDECGAGTEGAGLGGGGEGSGNLEAAPKVRPVTPPRRAPVRVLVARSTALNSRPSRWAT